MNALERSAEALRYVVLGIEFWISPDGQFRNWVKTNARVAAFIAAPTFIAFPVVLVALWELSSQIGSLTSIVKNLVSTPILVMLALLLFCRLRRR